MQLPIDLDRELYPFTTGGIGVATNRNLLPAPGAGFRYRIWGWSFGFNTHAVTGAMRGLLRETAVGVYIGNINASAQVPSQAVMFPGGVPLADNSDVVGTDSSSVAAQPVLYVVYYTIEATV